MDYPLVQMIISLSQAEVPDELHDKAISFQRKYSDELMSNSACDHLGQGWFILYDYPPAERWARECSWETKVHPCEDPSYTLVHFADPRGEVEMKLRWHRL